MTPWAYMYVHFSEAPVTLLCVQLVLYFKKNVMGINWLNVYVYSTNEETKTQVTWLDH